MTMSRANLAAQSRPTKGLRRAAALVLTVTGLMLAGSALAEKRSPASIKDVPQDCRECRERCDEEDEQDLQKCGFTGPGLEACLDAAQHAYDICIINCICDFGDC